MTNFLDKESNKNEKNRSQEILQKVLATLNILLENCPSAMEEHLENFSKVN